MSRTEHCEPCEKSDELARTIVDAAVEVHRTLGPGFLESVYEASLCHELALRRVGFERQRVVLVHYKGVSVGEGRLDLVVGTLVVVELKAVPALATIHTALGVSPGDADNLFDAGAAGEDHG